jgi:hypothetical protein
MLSRYPKEGVLASSPIGVGKCTKGARLSESFSTGERTLSQELLDIYSIEVLDWDVSLRLGSCWCSCGGVATCAGHFSFARVPSVARKRSHSLLGRAISCGCVRAGSAVLNLALTVVGLP